MKMSVNFFKSIILYMFQVNPGGDLDDDTQAEIKANFGELLLERYMEVLKQPDVFKTSVKCTNPRHEDSHHCSLFFL